MEYVHCPGCNYGCIKKDDIGYLYCPSCCTQWYIEKAPEEKETTKMKVTVRDPQKNNTVFLSHTKPGTFAVDKDGYLYFRTNTTGACIDNDYTNNTYQDVSQARVPVTPLPIGTSIIINLLEGDKMKVTINKPKDLIPIAQMPVGSVGVTETGEVYVRSEKSAVCLNDIGSSFSNNAHEVNGIYVTLIPKGSQISIEV